MLDTMLRRDKYEKHIKLYWVETKMAGRMLTLGYLDLKQLNRSVEGG